TDDQREGVERRIFDPVFLKECVETAQLAVMRKRLGARDIVRRGPGLRGDGEDAVGRREQKPRLGVNEAADQPGTGDAVYFGPLAGHPPVRPRGELPTTGQPELGPTRDAMFEETGV